MSRLAEIRKDLQKRAKPTLRNETFTRKIRAYKNLFTGKGSKDDAKVVLDDLISYTDADRSSYQPGLTNEQITTRAIIKKPVLRITEYLNHSDKKMRKLNNNNKT